MKKILLSFVTLMYITQIWAYTCKVNDICYNLYGDNMAAKVTYSGYPYNNDYTGHYHSSLSLKGKDIQIPSTISYDDLEYTVTTIGDYAFYDCEGTVLMSSVTIPSTVTSIGKQAFWKCVGLSSITIPNSVTSIGISAFGGCYALTSVTIGNNVTSIGDYAFYDCSSLTSVTCEATSVPSIGSDVFYNVPQSSATLYVPAGCKATYEAADYWKEFKMIVEMAPPSPIIEFADANVKALCIANWDTDNDGELSEAEAADVTDLGRVFTNNTNIKSFNELQYFTGLTSIGYSAFNGCSELTSITIPSNVTNIESYAFQNCSKLIGINMPVKIGVIGIGAFGNCSNLTNIDLANVAHIGQYAFSGCNQLSSIRFNEDIADIGTYAFYNTEWFNQQSEGLLYIGKCLYTYKGQISLNQTVDIEEYTTTIVGRAFENQGGLTSIIIPQNVDNIGDYAFSGCFCDVTVKNNVPIRIESVTFPNRNNQMLYVPYGSRSAYIESKDWNQFKKIVEMEDDTPQKCATPTISYEGGELTFNCETENVKFIYTIIPPSTTSGEGDNTVFSTTYLIKVYAKKDSYEDSDVATKEIDVSGMGGIRGDVNGDGVVNMPDAMFIVNKMLKGKFPDE